MICKNGCSHKINFLDENLRISTAIMAEGRFITNQPNSSGPEKDSLLVLHFKPKRLQHDAMRFLHNTRHLPSHRISDFPKDLTKAEINSKQ